jgi:hypothetical protein
MGNSGCMDTLHMPVRSLCIISHEFRVNFGGNLGVSWLPEKASCLNAQSNGIWTQLRIAVTSQ